MRVLLYARHRYPARRDDGTGLLPRPDPSGAPNHISDLLARGLAEQGHEVHYLLPAGAEAPLPEGVHHADRVPADVDIHHNLLVEGRPWVVTVQGYRPPAGYLDCYVDGSLVPDPAREAEPPYELPPNGICVSRTLAQTFGGTRYVLNGLDPAEFVFSEAKGDYFLFMAGMQGPAYPDMYLQKGLDVALDLSAEMGFELVVAGTTRDREVGEQVAALCREAGASYLGDVRGPRKAELLAGARGLLMPTRLHEGCPLVIGEALLSGTPVISSDVGACPEMVGPEVGFVCADKPAYLRAIESIGSISPRVCRAHALEEFHYQRMTAGYVREYEAELGGAVSYSDSLHSR